MLVLDSNGLRGVWACYVHILVLHPICTQMFTSALLWASGDVVAQVIMHASYHAHFSKGLQVHETHLVISLFIILSLIRKIQMQIV
jgi:hypothetical protein